MVKKPKAKQTPVVPASPQKAKRQRIIFIWACVIAGIAVAWFLTRNTSLYSVDKGQVRADVQSLLDQIDSPTGQEVYSEIVDQGCDSGGSVGLATNIDCNFTGYKYFESPTDVPSDLRNFAATIANDNWIVSSSEETASILNGNQSGSVGYSKYNGKIWTYVYIDFYKKQDKKINNITIAELIKYGKLPDNNTNIFGVRMTATYWSCRERSGFQQPCIFPPSEPK